MKMRRIIVLLVMMALYCVPAAGAESLTFVMESYEPYEYTEAGAFKGIDVDAIRLVCERAGCEPNFVDVPWNRAMSMVKNGEADAIFSLFRTEEREAFLVFPDEHLSLEKNVIVTAKGSGVTVNSLEDLKGKTVGVVDGYAYGDDFDNSDIFTKDAATDNDSVLKKQANGRTDAAVINELVLETVTPSLGLTDAFEIQNYVVSEGKMYAGFSKAKGEHSAKWAKTFGEHLKALRAEGKIK